MVLETQKEIEAPVIKLENSNAVLEREMEMMEEEAKAEIKAEEELTMSSTGRKVDGLSDAKISGRSSGNRITCY